jgi:hypothetical protein
MSRTRDRRVIANQTGMGAIHMGVVWWCQLSAKGSGFAGLAALTPQVGRAGGIDIYQAKGRPRDGPSKRWTAASPGQREIMERPNEDDSHH